MTGCAVVEDTYKCVHWMGQEFPVQVQTAPGWIVNGLGATGVAELLTRGGDWQSIGPGGLGAALCASNQYPRIREGL
jgi:hypothetical protein